MCVSVCVREREREREREKLNTYGRKIKGQERPRELIKVYKLQTESKKRAQANANIVEE